MFAKNPFLFLSLILLLAIIGPQAGSPLFVSALEENGIFLSGNDPLVPVQNERGANFLDTNFQYENPYLDFASNQREPANIPASAPASAPAPEPAQEPAAAPVAAPAPSELQNLDPLSGIGNDNSMVPVADNQQQQVAIPGNDNAAAAAPSPSVIYVTVTQTVTTTHYAMPSNGSYHYDHGKLQEDKGNSQLYFNTTATHSSFPTTTTASTTTYSPDSVLRIGKQPTSVSSNSGTIINSSSSSSNSNSSWSKTKTSSTSSVSSTPPATFDWKNNRKDEPIDVSKEPNLSEDNYYQEVTKQREVMTNPATGYNYTVNKNQTDDSFINKFIVYPNGATSISSGSMNFFCICFSIMALVIC
ncbi:hypothetical protein PACTADRAFT_33132 [Pachysolen tannophilus NRRL Y-2460]|uniref:Uncharacterized protein n=1 Tax=Pachysolen tannophilus NRRL Y-2460 TaxID=669874 RepID=A0A1E4TW22_PACTA|nr:hypothetical protein PACTADRAFT_33132 [Pachysolen tannophilus NRRL Y-2460]